MELHHQRLVFRTNGPDRHFASVFQPPLPDVLHWIGPNGGLRQLLGLRRRSCTTMRASSASNCSGVASRGLMSISLIQGCSSTSWLKRTSNPSSAVRLTGFAAAHSLQSGEDSRLLHQALGESGVERRKRQSVVAVHLDHYSARSEQNHGAELRIDAAAQNQFISVALTMGCTVTPAKCSARLSRTTEHLNRPVSGAYLLLHSEVSGALHRHLFCERSCWTRSFNTTGIADRGGSRDRFVFVSAACGFYDGNAVRGEKLLRLEFVEQRAAAPRSFLHESAFTLTRASADPSIPRPMPGFRKARAGCRCIATCR